MTRHTPGPWASVGAWVEHPDDDKGDICVCDSSFMGDSHLGRTHQECAANARLISCAPDMLAAIESIVNHGFDEEEDGWRLRQIIVNATGRKLRDLPKAKHD